MDPSEQPIAPQTSPMCPTRSASKASSYRGRYSYFLTFCTYRRRKVFRDASAASMVVAADSASRRAVRVRSFRVLPDAGPRCICFCTAARTARTFDVSPNARNRAPARSIAACATQPLVAGQLFRPHRATRGEPNWNCAVHAREPAEGGTGGVGVGAAHSVRFQHLVNRRTA